MGGRDGVEDGRVRSEAVVVVLVGVDGAHDVFVEALGEGAVDAVAGRAHSGGLAEDGAVGAGERHLGQLAVVSRHADVVDLAAGFGVGVVLAGRLVQAAEGRLGDLVHVDGLSPDPGGALRQGKFGTRSS